MITQEDVKKAMLTLKKYADGRKNLTERIRANELWYKQRHWDLIKDQRDRNERPEPTSGHMFNVIANKHADAMDNYPDPAVLAREPSDEKTAGVLSDILPVVLEYNNFEQVYSNLWYTKLRQGTGIYGVFWDSVKDNGVGDISIKNIDVLNFYFEPGISDIQDSKNIFVTTLIDNEDLKNAYPGELRDKSLSADKTIKNDYIYDDNIDTSEKSVIVDWYYKKRTGGKTLLHFAKFTGDTLLFSSENDENYNSGGWYEHGLYPFILDGLFPVEGTPFCFGYIDVCKPEQMYIDKIDQLVIENVFRAGKTRWIVKNSAGINIDDFADWNKSVITSDTAPMDSIYQLQQAPLDSTVINARALKVEELKEISGNRDFSQGGTASGVTAYSAIVALQEAGDKQSRDMIKRSYNAFTSVCEMCIELMRQFYTESRCFRITNGNNARYVDFDNSGIARQQTEQGADLSIRKPVFDIKVSAQKQSPFNRVAQNEMLHEFYNDGMLSPQNADTSLIALNSMDFECKDKIVEDVKQNAESQQKAQAFESLMSSPYSQQIQNILLQMQQEQQQDPDLADISQNKEEVM